MQEAVSGTGCNEMRTQTLWERQEADRNSRNTPSPSLRGKKQHDKTGFNFKAREGLTPAAMETPWPVLYVY